MFRTLLVGIGTEVALDTATTLDSATVVRVFNNSGVDATVSVAKSTTAGLNFLKKVLKILFQHPFQQL
jgi:hypothetical protein